MADVASIATRNDAILLRLYQIIWPLQALSSTTRKRPMEVLALGLPRTGTESLLEALRILGYDSSYHGFNVTADPRPAPLWCAFASHKFGGLAIPSQARPRQQQQTSTNLIPRAAFETILADFTVAADFPATAFPADLAAAYPEARIIINRRPGQDIDAEADGWCRSAWDTFVGMAEGKKGKTWMKWVVPWQAQMMWQKIVYLWVYKPYWSYDFLKNGGETYRRHYAELDSIAKSRDVLYWNVEEGWEPLCAFLGKPVPKEAFPHSNKPGDWEKTVMTLYQQRFKEAFRNIAVAVVLLIALLLEIWFHWL